MQNEMDYNQLTMSTYLINVRFVKERERQLQQIYGTHLQRHLGIN